MDIFVSILEIVGTVAFSASGALIAMKKKMDLLGVIVLGIVTAVGGGILRDVILGLTPPLAFRDPLSAIIAIATSVMLFIPWIRRRMMRKERLFDYSLFFMDSIGLGIFTVMGVWNAIEHASQDSTFLLVFVGVLSGVGGGMIRDVLAGDMPFVFVKHIYACASIVGALCCVLLHSILPDYIGMLTGSTMVFLIRILAAHFHWNLPKAEDV
ncbi:MAG: trimeric intracellular cation channel family protein [Ruminococcaceae bacterium]|nr:trimeric intracellular cation channel family protein [Oscillospiraceae bacterium]